MPGLLDHEGQLIGRSIKVWPDATLYMPVYYLGTHLGSNQYYPLALPLGQSSFAVPPPPSHPLEFLTVCPEGIRLRSLVVKTSSRR